MKTECKKGRIIPKNIHEGPLKLMGRYRLLNEEDSANMGALPNTGGNSHCQVYGFVCFGLAALFILGRTFVESEKVLHACSSNFTLFLLLFNSLLLGSLCTRGQVCIGPELNRSRRRCSPSWFLINYLTFIQYCDEVIKIKSLIKRYDFSHSCLHEASSIFPF